MKKDRSHFYKCLTQASEATIRLGISSEREYRKRYREDSMLPAHPYRIYREQWESWLLFLGIGSPNYKNYRDACAAARKLSIKSSVEYIKKRKADPKLPSNPARSYAQDWAGWRKFLSIDNTIYPTLKEAVAAAQQLGARSLREYKLRYKENPRLRQQPEQVYKEEWIDWYYYLGTEKIRKYRNLKAASKAARRLKIMTMPEYKLRYKEDPRLCCNPDREYKEDWVDWRVFLGTWGLAYESLAEASVAAKNIKFTSTSDYIKRYRLDPRLRATPHVVYKDDWTGWNNYLGINERYVTLIEASNAAQTLEIKSQASYFRRYKEDPKLPSSPDSYYKNEWRNWPHFLNKKKPVFYKTLDEASNAAEALGIKTSREYEKRYRENLHLHRLPNEYYVGWNGWKAFLRTECKKYETVNEASAAARKLGIQSVVEYRSAYKKDPFLPAAPFTYYKDSWENWHKYLGLETKFETLKEASICAVGLGITTSVEYHQRYTEDSRLYAYPNISYSNDWESWASFLNTLPKYPMSQRWNKVIRNYLNEQDNIPTKRAVIRKFYYFYFFEEMATECPSELLYKKYRFNTTSYESYVLSLSVKARRSSHAILSRFFDWILEEYCSDSDEGEIVVLPDYRNPLRSLLRKFSDSLPTFSHLSESNKPVLPLTKVQDARDFLFPKQFLDFSSALHLHEIFHLDWYSIEKENIDISDKDCVWRIDPSNSEMLQIWSPVRAIALYTLLKVPLRGQQILWLDSGEGDTELPDLNERNEIEWIKNTLPTAGCSDRSKGFIYKCGEKMVGMSITTNKTSTNFEQYKIPYIPIELAHLIIRLRKWQSKYNSINRLTNWTELTLSAERNRKRLESRGSQAFLFRVPGDEIGSPFRPGRVFSGYLSRVLFNIQSSNDDLAWQEKSKFKSKYTPHSIRTSLITAYVVDGGIPVHVISKLVGHASIVMTIYYTKIGNGRMSKELNRAEKIALSKSVDRLHDEIISEGIEKAKGELFSKEDKFLNSIDNEWPRSSYQVTDKGICAMGGGGCETGGLDEYGAPTMSPVPVGYLGRRNCIRCKYFITGPVFIGGLVALCNEIILEIKSVSKELNDCNIRWEGIKDEKYDCEIEGRIFKKNHTLRRCESESEEKSMKMDVFLSDYAAITSLIKRCREVLSDTKTSVGTALVASASVGEIDFKHVETRTDFRLLCEICENASIYTQSSVSRALPKRSLMLDRLAHLNGFAPLMLTLSEEEQLAIGNQAADLIKKYVTRWEDVDSLMEGRLSMKKIDVKGSEESFKRQFIMLLNNANVLPSLEQLDD